MGLVERGLMRLAITMVELVPADRLDITHPVNLNFILDSTDMLHPLIILEPDLKELRAALAAFGI